MGKILVLAAIIVGEVTLIFSEILGAHIYGGGEKTFWATFLRLVIPLTIGAWILLAGYILGLINFQNIWVLSVVSITSVLIFEPILAYAITGQLPTTGALIGFSLGAVGLIITLFW